MSMNQLSYSCQIVSLPLDQLEALKRENHQLKLELDNLRHLQGENNILIQQNKELKEDNKTLKNSIEKLEEENTNLHIQIESLKKELNETKKELNETKKELIETKKELIETKKELNETKKELIETKKELNETKKELIGLQSTIRINTNRKLFKNLVSGIQDLNCIYKLEQHESFSDIKNILRDKLRYYRNEEVHFINIKNNNNAKKLKQLAIYLELTKNNECIIDKFNNKFTKQFLPKIIKYLETQINMDDINHPKMQEYLERLEND